MSEIACGVDEGVGRGVEAGRRGGRGVTLAEDEEGTRGVAGGGRG